MPVPKPIDEVREIRAIYAAMSTIRGEAEPIEVRHLMALIVELIQQKEPLPKFALDYIANCLSYYLAGNSFDVSFGLRRRKKGSPGALASDRINTAKCFLEYRIAGRSWDEAVADTCAKVNKSKSVVESSWKEKKASAYFQCCVERKRKKSPYSPEEIARINAMLDDISTAMRATYGDVFFVPPENV